MSYKQGTIVFARRTQYGDNGKYDIKSGHPGMITIATDDITGDTYYLMLTSNVAKIISYPDKYFDLSDDWRTIPLKKPSLINLEYIYKGKRFDDTLGGLNPRLRKQVIAKMKEYQELHPCENYEKIKDKL